ncbi:MULTISPECIES: flagellar protein FlaG [unclassified Undibacterium]|nr:MULTISPECIES: flagellar protein FlaG [unclassified Undibacterium]MEB0214902.1 flagellar protein FlaG [Undibacterium sp. 5I2]WPX45340.1 flagellar protein FlaG [Undibacterium sp. CCC3.4]
MEIDQLTSTVASTSLNAFSTSKLAAGNGAADSAIVAPTAPPPAATTQSAASDAASLKQSAASLNKNAQPQFGRIEFSVDTQSDKMVLQVVDQETKQVLLQIPSKEALALSRSVADGGSLIRASA